MTYKIHPQGRPEDYMFLDAEDATEENFTAFFNVRDGAKITLVDSNLRKPVLKDGMGGFVFTEECVGPFVVYSQFQAAVGTRFVF
jgi:hypothetical protein